MTAEAISDDRLDDLKGKGDETDAHAFQLCRFLINTAKVPLKSSVILCDASLHPSPLRFTLHTFISIVIMNAIVALACLLFSPHVSARAWSPASASAYCAAYTVLAGDTCWNIMRTTGATFAQILSWNPTIDKQCTWVFGAHIFGICSPTNIIIET